MNGLALATDHGHLQALGIAGLKLQIPLWQST